VPFTEQLITQILKRAEQSSTLAPRVDDLQKVLRGEEPLRAGTPVTVRKADEAGKAPNGESFHIAVKASTSRIARDGGIVPIEAWENGGLERFRANPMIMPFHNYRTFPIGISVYEELNKENRTLEEYWRFNELTQDSKISRQMYEGGWMRAVSVGFIIRDGRFLTEKEAKEIKKNLGTEDDVFWMATRAEKLETSSAPIPSDPYALVFETSLSSGRAHGLDVSSISDVWAKQRESIIVTTSTESGTMPDQKKEDETTLKDVLNVMTEVRDLLKAGVRVAEPAKDEAIKKDETAKAETKKEEKREEKKKEDVSSDKQTDTDNIQIEVRQGETPEQAVARTIDEMIQARLGAPKSKK
jgi:hypothetical protein